MALNFADFDLGSSTTMSTDAIKILASCETVACSWITHSLEMNIGQKIKKVKNTSFLDLTNDFLSDIIFTKNYDEISNKWYHILIWVTT